MSIPTAFISYSHDSAEHKRWVLDFATRLRNTGIDAILDQWELKPGDDLPHFMESNLAKADRVLMICTDRYVEKANSGHGGVGYEKMIVTSELLSRIDSNKVVPIIRQSGSQKVPTFLKSKLFIDFSTEELAEFGFDELARTIHGAPLFVKPEIGNNPFVSPSASRPEPIGDSLREFMKAVVTEYDRHDNPYSRYGLVRIQSGMSRIMFDSLLDRAVSEGLVTTDSDGDIILMPKGRDYAVFHKLVV